LARSANHARTALFDLDGTLLPVELDFFLKHYMDALAQKFVSVMARDAFHRALLGATYETINNLDPGTSNLDAFASAFTRRAKLGWDAVWPTIRAYYADEYPELRRYVPPATCAASVVARCLEDGWDIVLATQPLFPEVAVRERMKWCGVESYPWRLVTTLDNMHFCKPHLEYYAEVLEKASLDPSRCVMIGNDMQEDMVAKKLGMKTYLVEDFLLDSGEDMAPDARGPLADVPAAIARLLTP
jgi:FMN phosphatase YigB (HAD superfamily)